MLFFRVIAAATLGLGFAGAAMAQAKDPIGQSAAVYGTYQSEVTDVGGKKLGSAAEIDDALTSLGGHNPTKLSQGWIAYSALIASQDPDYRKSVRELEGYYGRDRVMSGMRNDPRYARSLGGGDKAVSAALTASDADSRRITSTAAFVKEQAYSLQAAGWAKARIKNGGARADALMGKQSVGISANSAVLAAFDSPEMDAVLSRAGESGVGSVWDGVSSAATTIKVPEIVSSGLSRKRPKYGKEPIADQIATLAAYRVLDANASNPAQVQGAMDEKETKKCMKEANLMLNQCVAAVAQQFEVPFCISEHALADVGECIGTVYQ